MKINRIILLALGIAILFPACNKDKETAPSAYADSFIKSMIRNNQVVYNVLHYITSTSPMTSCTVQTPSGGTVTLLKYSSEGTSYYLEPDSASYSSVPPAAGNYVYTATYANGTVKTYTNVVTSSVLAPPVITSLTESADKQTVNILWNTVSGADGYAIRLSSGGTDINTFGPYVNTTQQVGLPRNFFAAKIPGTFKVEVIALLFESTAYTQLQAQGTNAQNITIAN